MDQNYKDIHQQADKLFYKFQSIIDDKNDAMATSAQHEIKEIVECIEMNKAPRFIEDRVREVQKMMEKVRSGQSHMMTPEDAALLIHEYEHLREQLRRLPNY
jgi:hypothetical protein